MGMYDLVLGIPDGYDNQFKCWDSTMQEYNGGDEVPSVGIAKTYAIQLNVNDPKKPPYFLIVTENRITETLAPDPAKGAPVFDKWGKYLGHGGKMLERPVNPMENMIAAMSPWTVKETPRGTEDAKKDVPKPGNTKKVDTHTHQLRLRQNFVAKIKLPADLTEQEGARLASWMESLPLDPSQS